MRKILIGCFVILIVCNGYAPPARLKRVDLSVLKNSVENPGGGVDIPSIDALDSAPKPVATNEISRKFTASTKRRRRRLPTESRRSWIRSATVVVAGVTIGGSTLHHAIAPTLKKFSSVNLTQVAQSTSLNVTVEGPLTMIAMDDTSFQKTQVLKLPNWLPTQLVPKPRVIRDITSQELLTAAIIAGSVLEVTRTSILYPLLTLKTRVQTDIKMRRRRRKRNITLRRRWKIAQLNAWRHFEEGKLYAGIVPTLLSSVPATGVYYGVRDLVKRGLAKLPIGDISISLTAAFCADVVSILIRTPADALAARLQKATGEESQLADEEAIDEEEMDAIVKEKVGNWFVESLERLPAITLTDLPYLLSRIAINRSIIQGHVDIGRYEIVVISTAVVCGILTTPFDVARTRILVDSDDDPNNGIDGGSGEGLITTFKTIINEGNDGYSNLFAGWLERTTYLAIGRAWLEPLQIIGYVALRDAILLEWFD